MKSTKFYLFNSRALTHVIFWLAYYLAFSLIWLKPDAGYFASFYLEFILLPVRMLAVYCMIYFLIPLYLVNKKYRQFLIGYFILLLISGILQRFFGYFFYEKLFLTNSGELIDFAALSRNVLLVNSTVIFVAAAKIFQLYVELIDTIENNTNNTIDVKSNRRIHRLNCQDILYIEGLGNYVTYHMKSGVEHIVYSTIKSSLANLSTSFIRLHRSFIINIYHIDSYTNENVKIKGKSIPRSKEVSDDMLRFV